MFIGHFALGLAAKRVSPKRSLATYLAAAQLPDLLWPVLLLVGVERVTIAPGDTAFTPLRFDSYPVSHSLLTVAAWGALLAGLVFWRGRDLRGALTCWALAVSHWLLDFASHRPDMPLAPQAATKLGLGLWNSVPLTLAVEAVLFALGVWVYVSATRARDTVGRWGFLAFLALMLAAYLGAAFGPPPPSVSAIEVTSLLGIAVFLGIAAWVDRHRPAREDARAASSDL
jgi:hypothetical protein